MKTGIQFKSQDHTIQGKFYSAVGESTTLLLLQGFPGNEYDVLGLGEKLSGHGFNTLTFNYRGTYRSEGEYSLKNTQEDIQAAFDYLHEAKTIGGFHINPDRLVLGGWSYGGGMALSYAANHPEIKQVFSIAGTDHGRFAREYLGNKAFADRLDELFEELKRPTGPVNFDGKSAILKELIQSPATYDLTSRAAEFTGRKLLLIGGWDDSNVTMEHHVLPVYRALKTAGVEQVKMEALQDDHAFEQTRPLLVNTIMNWLDTLFDE